MPYQVTRNGQTYGPYTLEDLARYVAAGNVLPTDLAKSDEMPDWLPVSQILNLPAAPTLHAPPANYPVSANPYPDPPNLHWALVLVIGLFTCGIFSIVWEIIQTVWVKKVEPGSKAMLYYIIFIVLEVLNIGGSIGRVAIIMHGGRNAAMTPASTGFRLLTVLVSIAIFVIVIVYRFTMRADIERHFNGPEPVGLRLSGVMTFFFGGLYFQYHFSRINEMKQSMRYRGAAV